MNNLDNIEMNSDDDLQQDIFDDTADVLEIELEEEGFDSDGYALSSSMALNDKELYQLSSRKKTKIIYVLGPVGSGKTTFEAMLYAYFLKNIDDEILFAGSETLVGFEERLNYLRTNSGNSEPQMARTSKDERRCFLHLTLFDTMTKSHYNLVFADISGETFESCSGNRFTLEQDLQFLDIANNIVLFIDGESLLDFSLRHSCIMKVRSFLMTLKSSTLYNNRCCIDIVISKNDLIHENTEATLTDYINELENTFDDLKDIFPIRVYRIEALNQVIKDKEHSTNLVDLLKCWMKDGESDEIVVENLANEKRQIYDDFNRFGERYWDD